MQNAVKPYSTNTKTLYLQIGQRRQPKECVGTKNGQAVVIQITAGMNRRRK